MIVSLRLCTAGILFGGFLVLASRVGAQVAALVSPTGNTVGSADPLLERREAHARIISAVYGARLVSPKLVDHIGAHSWRAAVTGQAVQSRRHSPAG